MDPIDVKLYCIGRSEHISSHVQVVIGIHRVFVLAFSEYGNSNLRIRQFSEQIDIAVSETFAKIINGSFKGCVAKITGICVDVTI